jgi:glycine cleavage system H protein
LNCPFTFDLVSKDTEVTPEQLLFAETHEWAHVAEEDGHQVATVGLSAFALEQLTDLVFIELPSVGTETKTGEEFGEVESVKAVSSLYSPVNGEVIAVNEQIQDNLETLSNDPYGGGWLVKIRLANDEGVSKLVDYAKYQKQCAAEHE